MRGMIAPATMFILAGIQVEGGLAVLAIVIAWFTHIPLRNMMRLELLPLVVAFVGIIPLLVFCKGIYMLPFRSVEFTRRFLRAFYHDFIRYCSVTQLLLVAIMSGIGEELLFRGVLQTSITQGFGGETRGLVIGIFLTSLLFGLVHPINILYVVVCFIIGIYLGLIFVLSGNNLVVPIIVHAFYNFILFLTLPQMVGFSHKKTVGS